MLIFIENTPRAYAWGSTDALAEMLGTSPTGEPQAELWLGTHPGSPAQVAKATPVEHTLIDLVQSDPDRYGVNGGPLPFLLKVLAIGAPLSLQVHPDAEQAAAGYAAEEAAGVPRDARERNYGDAQHKPELLVALSEVTALSGFRPIAAARSDLLQLAVCARAQGELAGADALEAASVRLGAAEPETARLDFLGWAFDPDSDAGAALAALPGAVAERATAAAADHDRIAALQRLIAAHPGDPGVLVSLLLHHVRLAPGEALFLPARQLHAYLGGIAVEVMAASDNVLRAGLTEKHVDIPELCRILDAREILEPRFPERNVRPGLVAWEPDIADFRLLRVRVCDRGDGAHGAHDDGTGAAAQVELGAAHPMVLMVTAGRIRVERVATQFAEVATARRGQSLYVSAGDPIRLTGAGEVFVATVGETQGAH